MVLRIATPLPHEAGFAGAPLRVLRIASPLPHKAVLAGTLLGCFGLRLLFPTGSPCGYPGLLGLSGLEPPTSRLSGVRSNRLSYKPTSSHTPLILGLRILRPRCAPLRLLFPTKQASRGPLLGCFGSRLLFPQGRPCGDPLRVLRIASPLPHKAVLAGAPLL